MQTQDVFMVSLDAGAIILDFNEIASNISGYTKEEVLGKNWFEIFIPDSNLVEVLKVFNGLFNGKNIDWEYTNEIVTKDGSKKTIKWINKLLKDERNRPIKVLSSGVEI